MVIKRVDPMSAAKIGGVLYALLGLVIGALVSLGAMAFGGMMSSLSSDQGSSGPGALVGMLFGAGAIIIMPICYGILGFVMTLISALIYNIAAKITGGIQVDAA
jgi:hypothetical protein